MGKCRISFWALFVVILIFISTNLSQAQTAPKSFKIRGTGLNNNATREFRIDDQIIYQHSGRGLRLTVLQKSDLSILLDQPFDTYGVESHSNNLAAALNAITKDQIGVLTSYDAWELNVTNTLDIAFLRLGLTKAAATINGGSRRPYAAIFEGGSGGVTTGKVVEVSYENTNNHPYAEIRGFFYEGSFLATGSKVNSLSRPQGNATEVIVDYDGNVGFGTVSPLKKLTINSGDLLFTGNRDNSLYLNGDNTLNKPMLLIGEQKRYGVGFKWDNGLNLDIIQFDNQDVFSEEPTKLGHFRVRDKVFYWSGNIGVGTDDPKEKLDVAGTIRATEIKVEAQTADFVFEPDYKLRSLDEVEAFVKTNKHLPDIPSAKQMEADGVNVAEMNKLLLQKVEELTLYMIEMKKENSDMKERLKILEKE